MGLRCLCVAIIVCVGAYAFPQPAEAAAPATARWRPPVDGPVVRGFEPAVTAYGPGHLGVDYTVAPGTTVRAAGPGVVAFAGRIGDAVHVVVAHASGLRTTYSFLAAAFVHRGEPVVTGQPVGRSGATGENHDGNVMHFGLRVGDKYVDPLLLFRPPDLSKVVHLAPHHDPLLDSVGKERRGLLAGLAHTAARAISAATAAVGRIETVSQLLARFPIEQRSRLLHLAVLGDLAGLAYVLDSAMPVAMADDTHAIAESLIAWAKSRGHCDPHALPADGSGGSGNRVMVVAGNDSRRRARGKSLDLPVERLGYAPSDVTYFSYSNDGGSYGPIDTHESLRRAAIQLRDQLRATQRAHPGEPVDLIAHSQGGVVTLTFLLFFYSPRDRSLPPLKTVVTLASPLRGDPLATIGAMLMTTHDGRALLAKARESGVSVRDLAERSNLIAALDSKRLPDQIALTTIGAAGDFIVPGSKAHLPGVAAVDVDPHAASPHTAILHDPHALRAVRAAIEHRALPCESFGEALTAAVAPVAITRIEHLGPVGDRVEQALG